MHREHQTWRPFKLLYNSNKTKLFTVPLFPLDRGGYGKIGDCEQSTTKHDTSQISSFILFHCLEPRRFWGFSTVVAAQGSWESFKNAKAQGKAQCDHDTLRRDYCRKSQEAHGYEAASSYWSSWQRSWWVTDTVVIKISLLTCPALENFKQGC